MRTNLFITAGAALIMATNAASAESPTDTTPGKPFPLLQILQAATAEPAPQAKTAPPAKSVPQARVAAKRVAKKPVSVARKSHNETARIAAAAEQLEPVETPAPSANDPILMAYAGSDPVWAAGAPSFARAATDPVDPPASPFVERAAGELMADGRNAQVAAADNFSAIPLVANDAPAPSATAALAQVDDGGDTRDTRFQDALATLGGALSGGSLGWFLFFGAATPRRLHG